MESSQSCLSCTPALVMSTATGTEEEKVKFSLVDPFLLEALENPRHRLTVLRMELDIQKFLQSSDQCQFEFQYFPTSYLRCAAHRVAQHYGLQTLVVENATDVSGSRILARKTPEIRYPAICLSEIPTKKHENEKTGHIKIVTRPRPSKTSPSNTEGWGSRTNLRTMEERKEEYDKARARIFNGSFGADNVPMADDDGRNSSSSADDKNTSNLLEELEKMGTKDGISSVAIFRDREKDLSDPDYNRNYDRYAPGFVPRNNFAMGTCNIFQPSHVRYDRAFSQLGYTAASVPSAQNAYRAVGYNQTSPGAVYMQWPTPAMVYAQSYEHFRHAVFQAPVYQQPLSIDHLQNI